MTMRRINTPPVKIAASRPTVKSTSQVVQGEALMTPSEVSQLLGVPVTTLYGWRHRGEGPVGYRIGRHVRYRRATVEEWIETQADHRTAS